MRQRKSLARVDDEVKRSTVQKAREYIFGRNLAVDSDLVESLLKEQSLTPNAVS